MFFKARKNHNFSVFERFFRATGAILILTTLVFGVAIFVKQVSVFDFDRVTAYSDPVLNKVGLSGEKLGEVAGKFVQRFYWTKSKVSTESTSNISEPAGEITEAEETAPIKTTILRIAVISDVENDIEGLRKTLLSVEKSGVKYAFFLGDFTEWGDETSLKTVKGFIDANSTGITYYAIPGDHDLAQSVSAGDVSGLANYTKVFGEDYHKVVLSGITFVFLNNSANYSTIPDDEIKKFSEDVRDAKFVLLSQPLYSTLMPDRVMGRVNGEEVKLVHDQAGAILATLRDSDVAAVIAGDQHNSNSVQDPDRASLNHFVVGAVTSKINLQSPRYSVLSIFSDGSYELDDVELN